MWKLIPKFARRWLFFVVALPLIAWGMERTAAMIESRRGPSRTTQLMREPRRLMMRARAA
jgi:hypothetical protein